MVILQFKHFDVVSVSSLVIFIIFFCYQIVASVIIKNKGLQGISNTYKNWQITSKY